MLGSWFRPRRRLPDPVPSEAQLRRWAHSDWIEYQAWLFHYGFLSLHQWQAQRAEALRLPRHTPRFSLITPVYNTPPAYLQECLYSVQTQTYPHWEVCLVDDGSSDPETLALLRRFCETDPRLRLHTLPSNQGICAATNQALALARGDYVAFLDHDDRLAPDALYQVAAALRARPDTDLVYTDRDMLSPQNRRFMHLFKPDWSPETLLSGNYLFHLLVYRRALVAELGGLRPDYEGSQDYDLILRAADRDLNVVHLPRVLYHWRQHPQSVSLQHDSKTYAYQAGIRALQDTLKRRGLRGEVSENPRLWRGNYRVRLEPPPASTWHTLRVADPAAYAETVNRAVADLPAGVEYLVIVGPGVEPPQTEALEELVAWLRVPGVAVTTGKLLDPGRTLLHAGLVHRPSGVPLAPYSGQPDTVAGYMAVTASLRNISAPHPLCCALRLNLLRELGGLLQTYPGPHALLDFTLRALAQGRRAVYNPFAEFFAEADTAAPHTWPAADAAGFAEAWRDWLHAGDPYYNPWLSLEVNDMGLRVEPPAVL